MTRRKRPYTPKVQGCHECSQRRIHCDRGKPGCVKCLTKGIQCSGLGLRYRFNQDIVRKSKARRMYESTPGQLDGQEFVSSSQDREDDEVTAVPFETTTQCTVALKSPLPCSSIPNLWSLTHTTPSSALKPWERYLILHFSRRIASEMVVIDDDHNGWRHLVLPMTYCDELVKDAVLSISAFHFVANVNDQLFDPGAMYLEVVRRLRQRQYLETNDSSEKDAVLLTLLLLLTANMVNGYSDFRTLFVLLEVALKAVGGERALMQGEIGAFTLKQIRKFRGYAAPLLGQEEGVAILGQTASIRPSSSNGWECFRSYYRLYPNLSESMTLVYDLNEQACNIYMARARAGPDGPPLTGLVDEFKNTLESFASGSPGEHVLVWATFIAALESTTSEHQQYFTESLMRHHRRNGFANIPAALKHLRQIWSEPNARDWTRLLSTLQVFIV